MSTIYNIVENDIISPIGDQLLREQSAPSFSTNVSYKKNDIVRYNDEIYQFTNSQQGNWNNNNVKKITLGDAIVESRVLILSFSNLNATTGTLITINDTRIKETMVALPILNLSNPKYQEDDWTINVNTGVVTITGTATNTACSGKIYLINE